MQIWLRAEIKVGERRTPLTPELARRLITDGVDVVVEKSASRIFSDEDYARAGCRLANAGAWSGAPRDAFILGLKELPPGDGPLQHRHIYFGHAYKNQFGWEDLIRRFAQGGGQLLDLEFLTDDNAKRVAAFGYWAGYAGAALGLELWAWQMTEPSLPFPACAAAETRDELVNALKPRLDKAIARSGRRPLILVIGAKGRCGTGARDLLTHSGLASEISAWDVEETAPGGPFADILRHDILLNCVFLNGPTKPFLTLDMLGSKRRLSAIVDVSCDPSSPHNPLPIYTDSTTFLAPARRLVNPPAALDLIAIDNLPSLLPRESSEDFAAALFPHLQLLENGSNAWSRCTDLFNSKVQSIKTI